MIACVPAARFDAVTTGTDPPLTGCVASTVAPSRNCTVPVAEAGDTEAVRSTFCPNTIVPLLAETAVVLGALVTVWVTTAEATALQLASPPYTAVIEWLPAESVVLANDALAPLTGTVASTAAPSRNCTLPVVAAGKRVAVNTTDCPITAGLRDDTSTIDVDALFTVCTQTPEALAR